jgi:eukaryotic-like serine/threonine-protein kinase
MSLAPGTRLGPYEIGALLGAGGMGEVYRATDTNLKRAVAIKFLPEALVADTERLARFQREAEVLASLNHPHIAQIHGLEKSTDRIGLVMELVEGPTLADRIAQGAIPINEAIAIAQQIAQALETAHEQGIIHRDLKPANVKVRDDGTVKVLDFGLAKIAGPPGGGHYVTGSGRLQPDLSMSPTITTPAMTQVGLILGTAAYMSPEQAKGRAADKRSDVWAFGCVLYEMLTGRRAFDGEDTSDTLASVLKTDPDWTALPADIPPPIRGLIQKCLAKDRRQRIADLSVVNFVLAERSAPSTPAAQTTAPARRTRALSVAAAVLATAVLVGIGAWMLAPATPERRIAKFSLTLPQGQQFPSTTRTVLAISPDGEQLAYTATNEVYVKGLSDFDGHAVSGVEKEGVLNPVFSPDGRSLAFFSQSDTAMKRVAITGGAPVTICPGVVGPWGMRWDEHGLVFGQGAQGIVRCAANGGKPEQLVSVAKDELAQGGQILPGGEWLLFSLAKESDTAERWDKSSVIVYSLKSKERRTVLESASDARYLPTGHLLYMAGGRLYAIGFDPVQLKTRGEAALVVDGVRRSVPSSGVGQMSISESGDLLYIPGPSRESLEFALATSDRTGRLTPLKVRAERFVHVRASRDGKRLAVDADDGREANISTYEIEGTGSLNRLTFGGRNLFPVWAPDGQRLAFQSDRGGTPALYVQRIDGTGLQQLTKPEKDESHIPESWSPDGRYISYAVLKNGWYTLWTLSLTNGKSERFGDIESRETLGSVFAPVGGWIAYHLLPRGASPLTSASGVFVEPFPRTGTQYQAPKIQRDFQPLWSWSSNELFYIGGTATGQLVAAPVTTNAGFRFETPTQFPFGLMAGRLSPGTRAFDVLPDGRFIGLVGDYTNSRSGVGAVGAATSDTEMRIILNWFDELKRNVPSN